MENSFIQQLVQQLPSDSDFHRSATIIFPTKRAGLYFEKAWIKEYGQQNLWLPEITSIQEFLYQHVPYVIEGENELLAILHPIHEQHTGLQQNFVSFYNWGKILLKDFSEIDQYLVDPDYLFHYVSSYKTIEEDGTLTTEQQNLLRQFWNNIEENSSSSNAKRNFIKTWESLDPIYKSFNDRLSKINCAYEGMAYRALLHQLENGEKKFSSRHFVLAGFNALSAFEERLFKHFSENYETKIFWDADSSYLNNKNLEAGLFINRYLKLFPDKVNQLIKTDLSQQEKTVEIVKTPLEISQIDYALNKAHLLGEKSTVIVLCDESLLYPLISKIPAETSYNITMGFPISLHPILSFLKYLIAFRQHKNVHHSISAILFVKLIKHGLLHNHINYKQRANLENLSIKLGFLNQQIIIEQLGKDHVVLKQLFSKEKNDVPFLLNVLDFLKVHASKFDQLVIEKIIDAVNDLILALKQSSIDTEEENLFKLIKQSITSLKIPFEGSSPEGLQIMGFLETRNLDFDHVLILGATEQHLPGTNKSSSFIPFTLRRAVNMPTYQENDAIYGYHFYRLLQRARQIDLISGNPIKDVVANPSRFSEQIKFEWQKYTPKISVNEINVDISMPAEDNQELLSIDKNHPLIIAEFEKYYNNEKQLSASWLSDYVRCPIQFYFKRIAKIKEPEEFIQDYDQKTLGKLLHKMMELFYQPFLNNAQWITTDILKAKLKQINWSDIMVAAFNEENIRYIENTSIGQNALVKDVLIHLAKSIVEKDSYSGIEFKIIGLELAIEDIPLRLSNGKTVYFRSYLDRVDVIKHSSGEERIRIIDYKTGQVKVQTPANTKKTLEDYISNYFTNTEFKAGLQGYVYAWMYDLSYPNKQLTMGWYGAKKLSEGLIKLNKGKVIPSEYIAEFRQQLQLFVEAVFDLSQPFMQCDDSKMYQYSAYSVLVE